MMRLTRDDVLKTKMPNKWFNTAFFPDTRLQEGEEDHTPQAAALKGRKEKSKELRVGANF